MKMLRWHPSWPTWPPRSPCGRRAALPAAGLALLLLAACNGPNGPSGEVGGESTIVVSYSVDMQGVNELTTQSTEIMNALIYQSWFRVLMEEQPDYEDGPPSFEPQLAKSYEFSEDRLRLTFHMRDDITWNDGVPVTAEDVRWTWQAQVHPEVAWGFADAKKRITDVEVVDLHTVTFHYSKAYSGQLLDATLGVVLPKHAWSQLPFEEWRQNNQWFIDHLVVNGPFTLESWEPQQRFAIRRNESYYGEPAKVDRIVFEVIQEESARLTLLRSKQAHIMAFVHPADAAVIEADPDLRLIAHIPRFFFFVQWNVSRPLLAEKRVRQALTLGIDRQEIVDAVYYGYATIGHSIFPSNHWAHNEDLEPWPYDPGRAREILAELGWVDTDGDGIVDRDGQPFSFELVTNSESQVRTDVIVMVQEHLKRIGVDVRTRSMEFNALLNPLSQHDFDAVMGGLAIDTSLNTEYFYHSNGIEGAYNWGVYSNPEMDQLIEEVNSRVDPLAAKPLYDQLQVMVHEELPMTYLYEQRRLCAVHKDLQGVEPNHVSTFYKLKNWRLENGAS